MDYSEPCHVEGESWVVTRSPFLHTSIKNNNNMHVEDFVM